MRTQRNIFDGRPRGSPAASGPVGAAPSAGGGNADVENMEDDYYVRDAEGGRAIDAADGPVDQQPGVGAPPPPVIIESTVAPELVQPSDTVVGHVTKLLSLKGRRAQRVREAFRGMIGGVALEHKCALNSVPACLIPWWPYKVSEDPRVVVEPEAIWPLQVAVPERLTLTTKRSRDGDAEGVKIITLVALPPVSGAIDQLVAAIMLLHDKEPATQQTLAKVVFLAKKVEILSAAEAATEVAARLAASKADAAASRATSATPPEPSGGGLVPIAPTPVSARAAAVNPFPPAVPRRPQDPFRLLGNLASGVKPPGHPIPHQAAGRRPGASRRGASGSSRDGCGGCCYCGAGWRQCGFPSRRGMHGAGRQHAPPSRHWTCRSRCGGRFKRGRGRLGHDALAWRWPAVHYLRQVHFGESCPASRGRGRRIL